jgi:hypothetical protein
MEQAGIGGFVGEGFGVADDDGDAIGQWNHGVSLL